MTRLRLFSLSLLLLSLARAGTAQVVDSARAAIDAARRDSVRSGPASPFWPDVIPGPPARAGAILPHKRIVAYYGNPRSTRMGILGQIAPEEMFKRLEAQAAEYAKADPATPVQPALELIATVAQADAGRDGMYRARMSDSLIERVYSWAQRHGWILILDVQVGRSTVQKELEPYRKFLERPDVHLALDPEFAMKPDQVPGKKIGTLDANDINWASTWLARIVEEKQLPPKVLIIHRFTRPMVTNFRSIVLDPRVQVVMHMDGFGPPSMKLASHRAYIQQEPVQWVGFKLFYKNDKPIMTPAQVVGLRPAPLFISYQ
jgi:hypothetical protein